MDDTVFETHYNLAVAYTQAEDYQNAIASYKKAIEINPDFADSYYSLAVALEDFSADLAKGVLTIDENGKAVKVDDETLKTQDKITLSPQTEKLISELIVAAVDNYAIYLKKGSNIQDADEVKEKIEQLNLEKVNYSVSGSES